MPDTSQSSEPERINGMAVWNGGEADDPWKIELESDVFSEDEGPVVSLYIENERGSSEDRKDECGLATMFPDQARAVAAELVALADHVEKRRAGS